jgi:hypothetical protein
MTRGGSVSLPGNRDRGTLTSIQVPGTARTTGMGDWLDSTRWAVALVP